MTSPIHLVTGSDLEVMFSEAVTELSSIFFLMGKMTLAMFRWNSHIGKERKQHFFSFNKLRFHFYTFKEAHDGIHRKTSHTGKILLGLDFLMKMHCRAQCWGPRKQLPALLHPAVPVLQCWGGFEKESTKDSAVTNSEK